MNSILLLKYIRWHFFVATKGLFLAWGNILWFLENFFSIGLLMRTYFAPWRRITWSYGRGFDIGRFLFVFSSNLISRILGAVMRTFLLSAGIFAELLVVCLMICALVVWIILPALIALAFLYGIFLLF